MPADFVIIGAMKCGTTTLAAQLAAQDGVFLTTPKEPNYFSDDDVFERGPAWYESLFATAPPGALRGEASTHYTKLPAYPRTVARMAEALDAPRLVYMLRDPIQRAVSHYIHEWSVGAMGPDTVAAFGAHPELVDYGRYAMQIRPFVDAFGRDSICITSLERLRRSPAEELARVGAHVGMRAAPVWRADLAMQNVSRDRFRKLPLQGLLVDNPVAAALRRRLVPKSVRRHIRQARSMQHRPELPDDLKASMRDVFAADLAELRDLFPEVELGFEESYMRVETA